MAFGISSVSQHLGITYSPSGGGPENTQHHDFLRMRNPPSRSALGELPLIVYYVYTLLLLYRSLVSIALCQILYLRP